MNQDTPVKKEPVQIEVRETRICAWCSGSGKILMRCPAEHHNHMINVTCGRCDGTGIHNPAWSILADGTGSAGSGRSGGTGFPKVDANMNQDDLVHFGAFLCTQCESGQHEHCAGTNFPEKIVHFCVCKLHGHDRERSVAEALLWAENRVKALRIG